MALACHVTQNIMAESITVPDNFLLHCHTYYHLLVSELELGSRDITVIYCSLAMIDWQFFFSLALNKKLILFSIVYYIFLRISKSNVTVAPTWHGCLSYRP